MQILSHLKSDNEIRGLVNPTVGPHMEAIAYLYFPTPAPELVSMLLKDIISAGIVLTHAGRNDPPRKWSGDVTELTKLALEQHEDNKYVFLRDSNNKIGVSLQLFYDPRWGYSTLSFGSPTKEGCVDLAMKLSKKIDPYLCIQGISGGGKDQAWSVLYERNDCPSKLLSRIRKA